MKKRIFSLALALALCVGLTAPVFAASTDDPVAAWNRDFASKTGLTMFSEKDPAAKRPWYETVYGLKDSSGKVVLPAKYADFSLLGNDRIVVRQTWVEDDFYDAVAYGVIDLKGNFLLPCSTNHAQIKTTDDGNRTLAVSFKSSIGSVLEHNSTALYDWNLNQLLPPKYNGISYAGNDCYILGINTGLASLATSEPPQVGVYKLGKGITVPLGYAAINSIGKDQFVVRRQDTFCGVLDSDARQILPFVFADVTAYKDGFYTVALFRDQKSFNAVQKQGLYSNGGIALFEHQGSVTTMGQNLGGNASVFEGWGYDMSNVPSYAVWGVVDKNQNVCTDFSYEHVKFDGAKVQLGTWNGAHELVKPYGNVSNIGVEILVKKYDYETKSISSLSKIGETLTSLIQKSGVAVPDMPSNPSVPAPSTIDGFNDVKASDYYADAVLWAVEKKITSGTSKTTFSPGRTCTTAEIITLIWRANGEPHPRADNLDYVDFEKYYTYSALWAKQSGLVSGKAFPADTPCTRADVVTYLWKLAGSPFSSSKSSFTDVPASADYTQAVEWAVEQKITSGTGGGKFSPAATCTRGQIVTFLYRAMGQ